MTDDIKVPSIAQIHAIGKYDATCEIFMHIRLKGTIPALREIATDVLKIDPKQPHAQWLLENVKELPNANT